MKYLKTKVKSKYFFAISIAIIVFITCIVFNTNTLMKKTSNQKLENISLEDAREKIELAVEASVNSMNVIDDDTLKNNINQLDGLNEVITEVNYPLNVRLNDYVFYITKAGDISVESDSVQGATYEVTKSSGDKYNVIIKIINNDGITELTTPDGNVISMDKKTKFAIDYLVEKDNRYTFLMKTDREEKELVLDTYKLNDINITVESSYEYPIISTYGVEIGKNASIDYKDGQDNYYSLDDGKTWKKYNNGVRATKEGTLKAKTLVEGEISQIVSENIRIQLASNALGLEAYDGNLSTEVLSSSAGWNYDAYGVGYINVDESLWNHKIRIWYNSDIRNPNVVMLNANGSELYRTGISSTEDSYTVVENTARIKFERRYSYVRIREIKPDNTPVFKETKQYAKITTMGVEKPYSDIELEYYETSIYRLYKIDDGEWTNYADEKIKVGVGQTIYAKGIDKNGTETVTASRTITIDNYALGLEAYDENLDTEVLSSSAGWETDFYGIAYINVDESLWNKRIRLYYNSQANSSNPKIVMINKDGGELARFNTGGTEASYTVPENTTKIKFERNYNYLRVREIQPDNLPVLNETKKYAKISSTGVDKAHSIINIDYYVTSVQKLYKIDDGEWTEFNGEEIRLEIGQTIYAKGIDINGKESKTSSKTSTIDSYALGLAAYDGNRGTEVLSAASGWEGDTYGIAYIDVDESLWNKTINVYYNSQSNSNNPKLVMLDENGTVLGRYGTWGITSYTILENTTRIKFERNYNYLRVQEIMPSN